MEWIKFKFSNDNVVEGYHKNFIEDVQELLIKAPMRNKKIVCIGKSINDSKIVYLNNVQSSIGIDTLKRKYRQFINEENKVPFFELKSWRVLAGDRNIVSSLLNNPID